MSNPAQVYAVIGGAEGCHALATAFYAQVALEPVLRPLFPSTFTCAIEAFSAFLVQFLGGEAEHTQRRWWLSLRESHQGFSIGARERDAWLRAMRTALEDHPVRDELMALFGAASAYLSGQDAEALSGELAPLWDEQVALDHAVAMVGNAGVIELLEGPVLRARFERSPAVHASVLSLAARSKNGAVREYAVARIRATADLVHERYKRGRTLLYDAAAAGDLRLAEMLLELGAIGYTEALYGVGNECTVPGGGRVVSLLIRSGARVNVAHGVKRCTPLHMAARRGSVEVIEALIDGGADMEARDSSGETPLRRAVNCNKVAAAKVLLARGADPYSVGSKGLTCVAAARVDRMKEVFLASGEVGFNE